MSSYNDKFKHSKRLLQEDSAIRKQQKIAKAHGIPTHQYEKHRFAKHHAMDCGNPECPVCGNPRKMNKQLTIQEAREFQNMERLRVSNGLIPSALE